MLAAGYGTRLRPLTDIRPKALCPVNNVALVDLAIDRAYALTPDVAVNASHFADRIAAHLSGRVHVSFENQPLGTAGAVANLREWIDGRGVLIQNADAWHLADLGVLAHDWNGDSVRLLVVPENRPSDFDNLRFAGASLMSWKHVLQLRPDPSSLYEELWKPMHERHELEFVLYGGPFIDCGTPQNYWRANMASSGGASVIGEGAVVEGAIERCVVWPHTRVKKGEVLRDAIRADQRLTVQCG